MRRWALCLVVVVASCSSTSDKPEAAPSTSTSTTSTTAATSTTAPAQSDPQLVAAGDIAVCATPSDEATAEVVAQHPGAAVAALGDLAYDRGTAAEFRDCYGPSWGRFKERTRPAAGNHEYGRGQARDYFAYWGAAAGPAGKGWYSYEVGEWHVVVLNSNCGIVGCGPDSEQGRWLAADLAAHRTRCALAYWHHPRFSSGLHGSSEVVAPLWDAMAAGGVDIVLSGHDHDYERFAPIGGVRQFVVGTGGAARYPFRLPAEPGSEARHTGTAGVLQLTLHAGSYDWRFLPAEPTDFADAGEADCRG